MEQITITGREEWTGRSKENCIKEGVVGISNSKIVGVISSECSKNKLDIIGTVTATQGHTNFI